MIVKYQLHVLFIFNGFFGTAEVTLSSLKKKKSDMTLILQ